MLELPLFGNSNVHQQKETISTCTTTYDIVKKRETVLKLTLIKYHAHLQHVKLPINVKIPVIIWKIVYMTALSLNLI